MCKLGDGDVSLAARLRPIGSCSYYERHWAAVLRCKIHLEDNALAARRATSAMMAAQND